MRMNPMIALMPVYGLVVVAMGLCLYLFTTMKREIRRLETRLKRSQTLLQEAYDRLESGVEGLKKGMSEFDQKTATLVSPVPAKSGMNLSKRVQAARMFNRGEKPEQVAAALNLPQNEVALLLKVQKATSLAS